MIKNKKHFIFTIVVATIALAINVFIVVHSCLNGMRSTEESGKIVNLLKSIIWKCMNYGKRIVTKDSMKENKCRS